MIDDKAWQEYEKSFREEGLPKMMESSIMLSIYDGDGSDFDVRQATELGAMMLLDKPIVLISIPGVTLPSRLRKAADVVIEDWDPDNHDAQARLTTAIKQLAGEIE